MATTSHASPIIYSIRQGNKDDPNINTAVEERIKELLEKFKDTQSIIYINIEKLSLDNPKGCRHTSRSRSRSRSRSKSRSRSRSHSHHRRGKHHHWHHSRGHRSPSHRHHPHPHHHFRHHPHRYPYHYFFSDADDTNCEVTTGAETTEEYSGVEACCKGQGKRHKRGGRRHSRSRSRGGRSRSKSKGKKNGKGCRGKVDKPDSKEAEEQDVIVIDGEEPKTPVDTEEDLETQFDTLNVSKS